MPPITVRCGGRGWIWTACHHAKKGAKWAWSDGLRRHAEVAVGAPGPLSSPTAGRQPSCPRPVICSPANPFPRGIPTRFATASPMPSSDAYLSAEPEARVAVETLCTTNLVILAGEVRGPDNLSHGVIEDVTRAAIKSIGYEQDRFHWRTAEVRVHVHPQSSNIAQGVDAVGNKGRGRRRPGHHVRLCLPRNPRTDARADPIFPCHIAFPRRGPPFGRRARPRPRRQEPGDLGLRERRAGAGRLRGGVDPAWGGPEPGPSARNRPSPCGQRPARRMDVRRGRILRQSDRQVRHRRSRRGYRPHRPQDRRRYLRRRGAPRWRRVLGQGPDQSRPLGLLRGALSGQERGGGGAGGSGVPFNSPTPSASPSRCRSISTPTVPARRTRTAFPRCFAIGSTCHRAASAGTSASNRPIYARTAAYGHFGRPPEADGGFSWERTDLVDDLRSAFGAA